MVRAELALERAQTIDVLHEGAGAERIGLVENLVADAGRGQAFGRELHADSGDLVGGNEDRASVAPLFVGHVDRVELGGNGAGLARLESGIEDRHRRFGDHAKDVEEESGQCRGNARHGADTHGAQSSPEFRQDPLRLNAVAGSAKCALPRLTASRLGKPCRGFGKIGLNFPEENFCRRAVTFIVRGVYVGRRTTAAQREGDLGTRRSRYVAKGKELALAF